VNGIPCSLPRSTKAVSFRLIEEAEAGVIDALLQGGGNFHIEQLEALELHMNAMELDGLQLLERMFKRTTCLTDLNVSFSDSSPYQGDFFKLPYMRSMGNLQRLSLRSLRLGYFHAMVYTESFSKMSQLQELDLSNNCIMMSVETIASELYDGNMVGLKSLNLSNNHLTCKGMYALLPFLSKIATSLTLLDLSSNLLADVKFFESLSNCFVEEVPGPPRRRRIATRLQTLNFSDQKFEHFSALPPNLTFPLSHYRPLFEHPVLPSLSLHGWKVDKVDLLASTSTGDLSLEFGPASCQTSPAGPLYEDLNFSCKKEDFEKLGRMLSMGMSVNHLKLAQTGHSTARLQGFLDALSSALLRPPPRHLVTLYLKGVKLGKSGYEMLLSSLQGAERGCLRRVNSKEDRNISPSSSSCASSSSTSSKKVLDDGRYLLQELDLSSTGINGECCKLVAEIISRFSLLKWLLLSENDLKCDEALVIHRAAMSLEHLELIDFQGSLVDDAGRWKIRSTTFCEILTSP